MHTKPFRITLLTSPASFLGTHAPCTRRRFHDNHLSSTRNALQPEISIHQTPECLHGRQLSGSGPLPLRDSFLISDPMSPSSRRYSIYHPILQSFMWAETVPRSSLCQRTGIQDRTWCEWKSNDKRSETDAKNLRDFCTSGWSFGWHSSKGEGDSSGAALGGRLGGPEDPRRREGDTAASAPAQ